MVDNISQPVKAKVRQPRKISPFWLLPIIAFGIGCVLFFQILKEQGEKITIRFKEGDGITAGKTVIRYQGLQIGQVKKVYFVDNLKEVQIEAEINPEAKSVLKEGTKFWLVKPSASLAGVSGLDALVSGNYISLLPTDKQDAKSLYDFIAEEDPPSISVTDGDLLVRLITDDLGSITVGAKVYFRKMPVGNIADYRFTSDQKKVEIDVVIDHKYASLVKKESHFWNMSGINVSASLSSGIELDMGSLASIVQGAIAFDSPDNSALAEQGQEFILFDNLKMALRGKEIAVNVPLSPHLKVNETSIYYQNMQIGVLSWLENKVNESEDTLSNSQPKATQKGILLIDPNYADLFRSGSHILLREPRFNLDKEQLSKIGELLRGTYFELISGKGEPQSDFTVEKESDYFINQPNVLALRLSASKSYGVDQGQGIYYNDVQVGKILKRQLQPDSVHFDAIIFPPYRYLIGDNTQFIAISNVDVSVNFDGVRIHSGSPTEWLKGGVRILPHTAKGTPRKHYPLYKNIDNAQDGITSDEKQTTLTLSATTLSGIDKGSVVLYRHYQIGEVLNVNLHQNQFSVDLYISPKYRHLITNTARFWIEPAVQFDLSSSGLSVQASPLMRSLKGAISLDNNGNKSDKTLYSSYEKAVSGHTYLTLFAKDGSKLSKGMPIKYMGLTIGNIERLQIDSAKKQVKATAYIDGQYYSMIAKSGSRFNAISPEIDTSGFKNLDAVIQNYIDVEIGDGERKTQFSIHNTESVKTKYSNGFPIIVETSDANGITAQAPVMYRGIQVGSVQRLSLSELGDRVLIYLNIANQYKHLVRKNSEFWASSGYTMDIGLNGASINSGTLSQLLNGGITFSTPSGKTVQPQAEPNRRYRLQQKAPQDSPSWDQGFSQ